jgi:hypothetical protein
VNSSRLAGIPIDHAVAELAAFPLASEAAFEIGVTHLDPLLQEQRPSGKATQQLWRQAERHFLGGFPAFSVEEAVAIRDRLWFGVAPPASSQSRSRMAHGQLECVVRSPQHMR